MMNYYTQRFSNDTDAIEYADANGISRSEIYYIGNDPCINIPLHSTPLDIRKKNSSNSSIPQGKEKYSGKAYVTARISGGRYWYDSSSKKNPKTYDLKHARIHKSIKSARTAIKFCDDPDSKFIIEVDAINGVAVRIKKEVK